MKLKSVLAAALGSSILLGATATSASANTEVKVWCWDANFNVAAAQMAAERYQAKHPGVTIKVENIGQPDIIQRLNASLGANNVRSLPDIVLIEDYRVQNFLTGYPDFLKELGTSIDMSKFVDYKIAASSDANGKHYGIPFDSGVTATYLRMDMFEKAGYTIDDSRTSLGISSLTWVRRSRKPLVLT